MTLRLPVFEAMTQAALERVHEDTELPRLPEELHALETELSGHLMIRHEDELDNELANRRGELSRRYYASIARLIEYRRRQPSQNDDVIDPSLSMMRMTQESALPDTPLHRLRGLIGSEEPALPSLTESPESPPGGGGRSDALGLSRQGQGRIGR